MKNEDEELTLEELQKQLEELKKENETLKEQLETPAVEEEVIEETDPIVEEEIKEIEEVEEEDDKETVLQKRLEAFWQRQVQLSLKEAGLEKFASFINVEIDNDDDLQTKVKELKALLEDYEVGDTYQPTSHTNTADSYSIAKKNRNPKEMLRARLG